MHRVQSFRKEKREGESCVFPFGKVLPPGLRTPAAYRPPVPRRTVREWQCVSSARRYIRMPMASRTYRVMESFARPFP